MRKNTKDTIRQTIINNVPKVIVPPATEIMIPGIRFIGGRTSAGSNIFVVEEAPRKRMVSFAHKIYGDFTHEHGNRTVSLAFPYAIHVVETVAYNNGQTFYFNKMKTFVRPGPLTSMKDELFVSPLPNFYNGHVCLQNVVPATTEMGVVSNAILKYWSSDFFSHGNASNDVRGMNDFYTKYRKKYPNWTINDWIKGTKENSPDATEWGGPWLCLSEDQTTLEGVIQNSGWKRGIDMLSEQKTPPWVDQIVDTVAYEVDRNR